MRTAKQQDSIRRRDRTEGCVYFARTPTGAIKIGFTTIDPVERLKQQRAQIGRCTLLGTRPGAIARERGIHFDLRGFSTRRVVGREVYIPCAAVFAEFPDGIVRCRVSTERGPFADEVDEVRGEALAEAIASDMYDAHHAEQS